MAKLNHPNIRHAKKDIPRFRWRGRTVDVHTSVPEVLEAAAKDPHCTVLTWVEPKAKDSDEDPKPKAKPKQKPGK